MLVTKLKPTEEIYYDYWSNKGYNYAECHYNEKIKNIYINIPKNASTSTRMAIQNLGFSGVSLLQSKRFPEYESAVVVLRDPIERWVSGITTYLNTYITGKDGVADFLESLNNNHKWLFELLFEKVSFDDHTEKQVYFLQPFDLSNCYYFFLDANFEFRLTQFYAGEGLSINFAHDLKNINKVDPIHKFFTEFLFDSKNNKYKEKLANYYQEDYNLINSTQFYGSR